MQNIATSNLSITNINNKTSTNPLVRFSGFPSTKSGFLCAFTLRNPHFRASRAQNRGFCAFLAFGTPVFRHFEHKIEVFVRFWGLEPLFSGISSTKSPFLCQNGRIFRDFWSFWHKNGVFVLGKHNNGRSCKSPRTLPKCKYLITR